MAKEKRPKRIPYQKLINYTMVALKDGKLKFLDLTGKLTNISNNGLCFITRYPLKAGCVVEFKNMVFQGSYGVIMWIRRLGGFYIAGTKLVRKDNLR